MGRGRFIAGKKKRNLLFFFALISFLVSYPPVLLYYPEPELNSVRWVVEFLHLLGRNFLRHEVHQKENKVILLRLPKRNMWMIPLRMTLDPYRCSIWWDMQEIFDKQSWHLRGMTICTSKGRWNRHVLCTCSVGCIGNTTDAIIILISITYHD